MEKYRNFSLFIILIPTLDLPNFYYMLGGNLGSLLYGDVSVINAGKEKYRWFSLNDFTIMFTKSCFQLMTSLSNIFYVTVICVSG